MIGVDFWSHCITKRVTIYAGRRVTVEQLLGAHISQEVLDLLANDRNPSTDHNDTTQFTLKVRICPRLGLNRVLTRRKARGCAFLCDQ